MIDGFLVPILVLSVSDQDLEAEGQRQIYDEYEEGGKLIVIVSLLLVGRHVPQEMVNVEIAIETTKLTFFTFDCIWANLNGRIIADDFDLVHKENPIKAQNAKR